MPMFYFHLHECGTIFEDPEGRDLPDFESAVIRALREARALMAAEVAAGHLCLDCHIEIEDREYGQRRVVPFREAAERQRAEAYRTPPLNGTTIITVVIDTDPCT